MIKDFILSQNAAFYMIDKNMSEENVFACGNFYYEDHSVPSSFTVKKTLKQIPIKNIEKIFCFLAPMLESYFFVNDKKEVFGCGSDIHSRIIPASNKKEKRRLNIVSFDNPYKVPIDNVKHITPCFNYVLYLKEDGTVWATGNNGFGQLGLNDKKYFNKIVQLPLEKIDSMCSYTNKAYASAGNFQYSYSVFLDKNGSVWFCGSTSLMKTINKIAGGKMKNDPVMIWDAKKQKEKITSINIDKWIIYLVTENKNIWMINSLNSKSEECIYPVNAKNVSDIFFAKPYLIHIDTDSNVYLNRFQFKNAFVFDEIKQFIFNLKSLTDAPVKKVVCQNNMFYNKATVLWLFENGKVAKSQILFEKEGKINFELEGFLNINDTIVDIKCNSNVFLMMSDKGEIYALGKDIQGITNTEDNNYTLYEEPTKVNLNEIIYKHLTLQNISNSVTTITNKRKNICLKL